MTNKEKLDLIDNAILNQGKNNHQSYTIDGLQINRLPLSELRQLRVFYAERVRRDEGGSFLRSINVEL